MEQGDGGGRAQCVAQCLKNWGNNALKFGVTTPQNWRSYCPTILGLIVPNFEVTLPPILGSHNWGPKCTTLRGHDIPHFEVKLTPRGDHSAPHLG